MATNLDWTQSASLGYVPTFGSGTLNTSVQSANDVDISSLLRGDASASGSHSQSAPAEERRSSNGRVASPTQANTVSAVKPNESLTSEDPRMGLNIPTTPPRAFEQPFWSGPNGVSSNIDGLTGYQATLHEPERPKGPVKPKPVPSNPRLFRPFALNELQDTMLEHWRTPTVMGSYVLFPNKRLKYNPVPPKLELVREKLFRVEEPILLKSSQEVADYIPHVTNLWRNSVERIRSNEGGLVVEYWHCRSRQNKSSTPNANRAPKGVRNRDKKCEVMFGMLLSHMYLAFRRMRLTLAQDSKKTAQCGYA